VLVHRLPDEPSLRERWLLQRAQNSVLVGTGCERDWETMPTTPLREKLLPVAPASQAADQSLSEEAERIVQEIQERADPELEHAYLLAAAFDAWNAPVPLTLFEKVVQGSSATGVLSRALSYRLLYLVAAGGSEYVATGSSAVARRAAPRLLGKENTSTKQRLTEIYEIVLKRVDPSAAAESGLTVQLFQSLLNAGTWWSARKLWGFQDSRRQWLQRLAERAQLQRLWDVSEGAHRLAWVQILERIGKEDEAARLLAGALRSDPDNRYLLHLQAMCRARVALRDRARKPEALHAFQRLLNSEPNNVHAWHAWAMLEKDLGSPETARQLLGKARTCAGPADVPHILVAWADLECEAGDAQQGRALLEEAERLDPSNPYIGHLRGKVAFNEGRWREALHEFLQSRHRLTATLPALNAAGHLCRVRGHWRAASDFLEQALDLDPENVPTLHELALLRAEEERDRAEQAGRTRLVEASRLLERALDIEPENHSLLVSKARLLILQGEGEQAEEILQRIMSSDPSNAHARHVLAELYTQQERYEEAAAVLERAGRQDIAAAIARVKLYRQTGRPDNAQRLLVEVETTLQAVTPRRSGARDQGETSFRPVHELIRAWNAVAKLRLEEGAATAARAAVERAEVLDSENAYTLRLKAHVLGALGEPAADGAPEAERRARELAMAPGPSFAEAGAQ